MPAISSDGADYCWQARDLGREPLATLRSNRYGQHPLFALTILGVQRCAGALGAAGTPLLWQRCGQGVALFCGVLVVALTGLLAHRLTRLLALPLDLSTVTLLALLFAALLPLNNWLSADVMSEPLFLSFYLGAVILLFDLRIAIRAAAAGLLAGFAFLTRPEGALVYLAALAVLFTPRNPLPWNRRLRLAALVTCTFALCAAPFVAASGGLSPKLGKETFERSQPAERVATALSPSPAPQTARLLREDVTWWLAGPRALWEIARAGRVIVPLLALPPLLQLRRRFREPALLAVLLCAAGHFALTGLLVYRHGYLHPRHTLVVIVLLIPFAAMLLARLLALAAARGRITQALVLAICFLPLATYDLRVPNGADGHLRRAADWLVGHAPHSAGKLLLGGASERRIAFYADLRWQPWPENEADPDLRRAALRDHLVHFRPDFFAITTGPRAELRENAELLADLLAADRDLAAAARVFHVEHGFDDVQLRLFALDFPTPRLDSPPTQP